MKKNISDDEIELFILQKCVNQHKKADVDENLRNDKCAHEIDILKALAEITGELGSSLQHSAKIWLNRLAPRGEPKKGPLCRCSNSRLNRNEHKFHVRAFVDPYNKATSAWDRVRALEKQITHEEELEQKFGILYSASQMKKDFIQWMINEEETKHQIALLFIDIDDFKKEVNEKYTEAVVDQTLLPEFQTLLKEITSSDGTVYRYGGEEFGILLPNHNQDDAKRFAEKLRFIVESKIFNIEDKKQTITVSIGVALWPNHGNRYEKVLAAANKAEHEAKSKGKNLVVLATL